MHAYVQCFALLLMPPFILKVAKRVRPDIPQQGYVTKASFTEMQTRKFPSKGLVLNSAYGCYLLLFMSMHVSSLIYVFACA
jgi:hypothetical protein